jgi:tRNA-binding EMAP/Myf-like protein
VNQDAFTKILLKVGVIEEIMEHPEADTLYVETINLGEESGSRQIVSGLKPHYPDMASLKGRKVVVSCCVLFVCLVGCCCFLLLFFGRDSDFFFFFFYLFLLSSSLQVVANLKKANLVKVASTGMVLCAVDKETGETQIVDPPADAEIGERVFVDGFDGVAMSESAEKKKKAWRKLQPELGTDERSSCVWNGLPMRTKTGVLTVVSLKGAALK